MLSFFRKLISGSDQKNSEEIFINLYLSIDKTKKIEIKIDQKITLNEIREHYLENLKHALNESLSSIQSENFFFILIDDECPLIQIKLRNIDNPYKFIKKKSNLYFLQKSKKNSENTEKQVCQEIMLYDETCVREGEIYKYSMKHNVFRRKKIFLTKQKLTLQDSKSKKINVIHLVDIRLVGFTNFKKEKYPFEIQTYDDEKYIFATKTEFEQRAWVQDIFLHKNQVSDNKLINDFSTTIKKIYGKISEEEKQIVETCLNIHSVLSDKLTRELFFNHLKDPLFAEFVDYCFRYKKTMKRLEFNSAKEHVEKIIEILMITGNYYEDIIKKENELKLIEENQKSIFKENKYKKKFSIKYIPHINMYRTIEYEKEENENLFYNGLENENVEDSLDSPTKRKFKFMRRIKKNSSIKQTLNQSNHNFLKNNISNSLPLDKSLESSLMDKVSTSLEISDPSIETIENPREMSSIQKIQVIFGLNNYKKIKELKEKLDIYDQNRENSDGNFCYKNKDLSQILKNKDLDEVFNNTVVFLHRHYFQSFKLEKSEELISILLNYWKMKNLSNNDKICDVIYEEHIHNLALKDIKYDGLGAEFQIYPDFEVIMKMNMKMIN